MDDEDNTDDELPPDEMDVETPEDWYDPSTFDGDEIGGFGGKGFEYLKEPFGRSWMDNEDEDEEKVKPKVKVKQMRYS